MNITCRLALVISLLICSAELPAQETINSITSDNGNSVIWTINQPTVNQSSEVFRQILFQPNDEIFISAGGCVQTGGGGLTWKSYVNPSGDNSDRLYSGQINIRGVTLGLQRIGPYLGRSLFIPNNPTLVNSFLTLGYQDDNDKDNGYLNHDDGTEGQCKGVGDAFVTIKITHHSMAPPAQTQHFKDFDIVAMDWDVNGFPLNPKFGALVNIPPSFPSLKNKTDNFFPNFTTFPVTWESNEVCSDAFAEFASELTWGGSREITDTRAGWPADHINMLPVAYQGNIYWDEHSGSDDDYSLIVTSDDSSCYVDDGHQVYVEFDSDETVDNWDYTATWWVDFRHNGVDKSHEAAVAKLDGKQVFIVGLLGIDSQHGPHFELHPAYVFFIKDSVGSLDVYHFFVRNWGDEGFCSGNEQWLDLNTIQIKLPNAATNVSKSVFSGSINNDKDPSIHWEQDPMNDGVMLTFNLKNPDQRSWFEGDLSYTRIVQGPPPMPLSHLVTIPTLKREYEKVTTEKMSVEEVMDKKIATLSSASRQKLFAELKGRPTTRTKGFLNNGVIHKTILKDYTRHSNIPIVINKDFIRVIPNITMKVKRPNETVTILKKYFPSKKN